MTNRKHSHIDNGDQNEVSNIIACLSELKQKVACILKCLDEHSSGIKERIIFCILLEEIRKIEQKLDSPPFSLSEIKSEMLDVKSGVQHIEHFLANRTDLENEFTKLTDIVNNTAHGIPEINNELHVIGNTVTNINQAIHNQRCSLNELKNEVNNKLKCIETSLSAIKNSRQLSSNTDSVSICGKGVDNKLSTVTTDTHSVLATLPGASALSQIGRLYSVATDFVLNVYSCNSGIGITNPATSNRTMYLERIIAGDILSPINQLLSYDSGIRMKILSDPSITESKPIKTNNLNLGCPDNSQSQAYRISAFSDGTEIVRTANVAGHIAVEFYGQIIIPPGHSVAIMISNELSLPGRTIIGDITIIWYELDTP